MAATFWQAVNEDVGSAANWTNGTPDSTHTPAIADGRSQASMKVNVDRTGDVFVLKTARAYTGQIGSPGNPLKWDGLGSANIHHLAGSGNAWLEAATSNRFLMDAKASNGPTVLLSNTQLQEIYCRGSNNTILDPKCTGAIRIFMVGSAARLTMQAADGSEQAPQIVDMRAGVFTNHRNYVFASQDHIFVSGGVLNQHGYLQSATVSVITGGVMKYIPRDDQTHTTPLIDVLGGILDLRETDQIFDPFRMVIGPDGNILGSRVEDEHGIADLDLRLTSP